MTTVVSVAVLSADRLTAEINRLRPRTRFAILESPEKIHFPGPQDPVDEWTAWPRGRVFGDQLELRWEQEDEAWRAVLVQADGGDPPSGFEVALTLDESTARSREAYFLWGENDAAIGGRLNYSRVIPGKGRGQVWVVRYTDATGRLVFHRYVELKREDAGGAKDPD